MHQLCEIYRGTEGVQIPTNLRHKGHICLLCVSDKIWPPALLSALREGGHVGMVSVDDSPGKCGHVRMRGSHTCFYFSACAVKLQRS